VKQAHEELLPVVAAARGIDETDRHSQADDRGFGGPFWQRRVKRGICWNWLWNKKDKNRTGFHQCCRMILMEAALPMSAREVCDKIQEKMPPMLARHRDPIASVTTSCIGSQVMERRKPL